VQEVARWKAQELRDVHARSFFGRETGNRLSRFVDGGQVPVKIGGKYEVVRVVEEIAVARVGLIHGMQRPARVSYANDGFEDCLAAVERNGRGRNFDIHRGAVFAEVSSPAGYLAGAARGIALLRRRSPV